jgi:hypothetical protein
MLRIPQLNAACMAQEPFQWAFVDNLFEPADAAALAATFPCDNFKTVAGYDGEKGYEYVSRSLVHMGSNLISHPEGLSPAWHALALDLLSPVYREAMSRLTGCNLGALDMEVNVIHYGPGAFLGPHLDLKEKVVTHVLYFNDAWDARNGGCLHVLRSKDTADIHASVLPIVGNSSVLVRSEQSWHTVSRVTEGVTGSRRSINVIFHLPGSISTMWPPSETPELFTYQP